MSLLNKASILTTPTSYENGKILSVKPVQSFGSELVSQPNFQSQGSWFVFNNNQGTIGGGTATIIGDGSNAFAQWRHNFSVSTSKKYELIVTISETNNNIEIAAASGVTDFPNKDNAQTGTHTFRFTPTAPNFVLKIGINNNPNGNATLTFVSLKEVIDADFDFTRNSSATRTNSQGLIEDMQILSGDLVSNGDFSQEGAELVTNGSFTNGTTDWAFTSGASLTDLGAKITHTPTAGQITQANTLVVGKQYKFTYEITESVSGGLKLNSSDVNTMVTSVGVYTIYFKANQGTLAIARTNPSDNDVTITNISVKEVGQDWSLSADSSIFQGFANVSSTGTYQYISQSGILTVGKKYKVEYTILNGSTGTLKLGTSLGVSSIISTVGTHSVIANALTTDFFIERLSVCDVNITNISVIEITDDTNLPRIDYTGGEGHWLFEPQSTNLLSYSESTNGWSVNGNITVTSNATISPEGVNNAVKLQNITTSSSNQCVHFNAPSSYGVSVVGKTYSASIYIKPVNASDVGKIIELSIQRVAGDFEGVSVNLEITSDDWKRYVINYPFTGTGSGNQTGVAFKILKNSTTIDDIYIWGAQVEEQSYATSYIPTNGEVNGVTRLADTAFGAGSSDLINSTSGVLYAEIAALANDSTPREISLSDGTANNRIELRYGAFSDRIQIVARNEGGIQANISSSGYDILLNNKVAVKYKANDFALWINGVEVGTDTSGAAPIGLSELAFDDGDGNNGFFGKAKCVAVFKEALNNDELECLTGDGYETFNALALANNYIII